MQYRTITQTHTHTIPLIKRSKFVGIIFSLAQKDVYKYIDHLWLEYPKASHICYAYRQGVSVQRDIRDEPYLQSHHEYSQDDGEPRGSAGAPILRVLQGADLRNVGCAVIRYYGGTNLGIGGLIQAYTQATQEVIKHANIFTQPVLRELSIHCSREQYPHLMEYLNHYQPLPKTEADYMSIQCTIPRSDYDDCVAYLDSLNISCT